MKKRTTFANVIGAGLMMATAASADPYNPGERALGGGLLGAGTGAVIGAIAGGGRGAGIGAAVGGFIIGITESLGGLLLGEQLGQIGISLIFILILLLRPTGLFGGR